MRQRGGERESERQVLACRSAKGCASAEFSRPTHRVRTVHAGRACDGELCAGFAGVVRCSAVLWC